SARSFRLDLSLDEPPVAVDWQLLSGPALFLSGLTVCRRPVNGDAVDLFRFAQSEEQTVVAGGQVTAAAFDETGQTPLAHLQLDARPNHVAAVLACQFNAEAVLVLRWLV